MRIYCHHRSSFPYRLCSRLVGYYWETDIDKPHFKHWGKIDMEMEMFMALVETVCLYIALTNEEARLQDYKKIFLDNADQAPQAKEEVEAKRTEPVAIPHELNKPEGRTLLQRVIDAGFCDENYNWDSNKWKKGKSRLALACFAYRASVYLNLSTKTNKNGESTTNWQPFETLLTYQGKAESKNKLMQAKKDFMSTHNLFDPEEMDNIDNLFN